MTQASAMPCTPCESANTSYIMNTIKRLPRGLLDSLLLTALLALSLGAMAQGQGHGKGRNKQQAAEPPAAAASQAAATAGAKGVPPATTLSVKAYLSDAQRKIIQDHYASQQKRTGRCPPGLAKKNNGCMPPGQAKKWAMGQPLPADAPRQPLPEAVLKKIGMIEKGIEIVRILNDVVVLNKGNRAVLDAVEIFGQR